MRIYKTEIADGLYDKIASSFSFAYQTEAKLLDTSKLDKASWEKIVQLSKTSNAYAAVAGLQDLHPLDSIMVSVGWNLNTDIFLKDEVWQARGSPVHKPLDYEHDESDIIGHIIAARPVDSDYKAIAELTNDNKEIALDDLPTQYHIFTNAVLYKIWRDEARQKRMDNIIKEIPEGKWYVSMECLFTSYDYGVRTPDGTEKIIPRTEASAFLTKHLRAYGGTGKYDGNEIGRVLRNITFSGKGLVRKPANPASIIFASVQPFSSKEIFDTKSDMGYNINVKDNNQGEIIMSAELQSKIDALTKQLEDMKNENLSLRTEGHKASVAKISELENEIKSKSTSLAEVSKKFEETNKALTETKASLVKIEAERTLATRITKLNDAGLEKAEATSVAATLVSLNDEQFNAYFASMESVFAAKKQKTPKAPEGGTYTVEGETENLDKAEQQAKKERKAKVMDKDCSTSVAKKKDEEDDEEEEEETEKKVKEENKKATKAAKKKDEEDEEDDEDDEEEMKKKKKADAASKKNDAEEATEKAYKDADKQSKKNSTKVTASEEEDENEDAVTPEDLENATPNGEPALATSGVKSNVTGDLHKAIASYYKSVKPSVKSATKEEDEE